MRITVQRGRTDRLETLHPAYFAMVMATGIVSLSMQLQGLSHVAWSLFVLNLVFYVCLLALFICRAAWHYLAFVTDLSNSQRGVGFFTWAAAPGILGSQCILVAGQPSVALLFWIAAVFFWITSAYGIFAAIILRTDKPTMAQALNGGWLVSTVATQSVAILTVLLARSGVWGQQTEFAMFAALAMWLGGGMQYVLVISMLFQRMTILPITAHDLAPPYWINMGAVAISTLAGTVLINAANLSPVIASLSEFIRGVSLLYWSIGTGWVPMLLVFGVWRFIVERSPLAYDPLLWSMVFPIGMYSTCTFLLGETLQVDFLQPAASIFAGLAALAWIGVATGFVASRLGAAEEEQAETGGQQKSHFGDVK